MAIFRRLPVIMLSVLSALSAPTFVVGGASRRFSATSTAVITLKMTDMSIFGTTASDSGWGASLESESSFYPVFYTTTSLTDPFGCTPPDQLGANESTFTLPAANQSFVLLVDRGRCTFTEKAAIAQQLGAVGVVITDTMQQAYNRTLHVNTTDTIKAEMNKALEYSCKNGKGDAASDVDLTDFTASTWEDAVNVKRCTTMSSCESERCIPTGNGQQVCCLWDIAESMSFGETDAVNDPEDITIAVVRIKLSDGVLLKQMITDSDAPVQVTITNRHAPRMDPSQFIIWLMAIITVMIGGYKGATLERERALRKQSIANNNNHSNQHTTTNNSFSPQSATTGGGGAHHNSTATGATATMDEELMMDDEDLGDETMDLTIYHAIFFVVFATVFLLVLFYFNVVIVVIIFFAIGSVSCSFYILWQPFYHRATFLTVRPFGDKPPTNGWLAKLEPQFWTLADMFAFVTSLAISLVWFIFRSRQYAWLLQDVFGVCLCILFLRTIRLPNLKIATVMLVLVFIYDVFMVFISPYIFQESVMIKAATGGNQAEPTSSSYCLRYPSDSQNNCQKEQMPILLRFPKVIDWRDGVSMLGLGDIVLPGLLIVFCARFDYATRGQLLGRVKAPHLARLKTTNQLELPSANPTNTNNNSDQQSSTGAGAYLPELTTDGVPAASRRGLFGILMWGYALGLLAANVGVAVMKQGQPALMYLVPTTLGTLVLVSWRRGILRKLWDGPEEFRAAGHARTMTTATRDRGFTVDHVIETSDDHGVVVMSSDATPQATYARTQDSPRRQAM